MEESIRELESLLKAEEGYRDHALGWKTVGLGWFFVGDPVRAEAAFLAARDLDRDDGVVRQHLGRIYLQRSLEALRTKEVTSPQGKRALSEKWALKAEKLLEEKGPDLENADEFERLLAKAYLARARGNQPALILICNKALSEYSDRLGAEEFIFFMGTVENGEGAIGKFTAVIERAPNHSRAYYERGMSRAREGKFVEAKKDLDQAIRINPRSVWSYISRGILWKRLGDGKKSLEDFSRGLGYLDLHEPIYDLMQRPRYGQVLAGRIHREMASLHLAESDLEKAMHSLDTAIRLNGKDAKSRLRRGNLFRKQKEWARALEDYRELISLLEESGKSTDQARKVVGDLEKRLQGR